MNNTLVSQLLEESISLAEEENVIETVSAFSSFICEMLPMEVLQQLEDINGSTEFLEDIWHERFEEVINRRNAKEQAKSQSVEEQLEEGQCLICEREVRLTRHHVFPRETHKNLIKKGYDSSQLNTTIPICRMCHNSVHRFFTNSELSESFYTVELLLSDDRMVKYAKWASMQSDKRYCKN